MNIMDQLSLYEGRACHTRHARVVTNETLLYDALLIDSLNLGGRTPPSDIDGERDEGGYEEKNEPMVQKKKRKLEDDFVNKFFNNERFEKQNRKQTNKKIKR